MAPDAELVADAIANDGATGTPALSIGDAVIDESAQSASFFVSLSRPSVTPVTVAYGSANDTALAGQDYASLAGSLSFAPGETVKTVTVNLIDDTLAETDEAFNLLLTNPSGATLADANGTYTQASLLELVTTLDLNTVELVGIVGQVLSLDPAYFPAPG